MGFLKKIFALRSPTPPKVKFDFYILDSEDPIPIGKWYQKDSWNNKNFVSYRGKWSNDWKYAEDSEVKIAGISRGARARDFLSIAQLENFKLFLESEPDNPVNKHARKVMASGMMNGEIIDRHIGYLPDEIATKYAGKEIDIHPRSVFLPRDAGLNVGVKLTLLVRSARYLK